MSQENKEAPGAATPGATRVEELTSLLNQIDRQVSGLTIRLSCNLKSGKQFTAEEIDSLLAEVTSSSKVVNVNPADKCLKSENCGTVGLVQSDSKLKKILDRAQFLRPSKILNLLRHRGI